MVGLEMRQSGEDELQDAEMTASRLPARSLLPLGPLGGATRTETIDSGSKEEVWRW